MLLTIRISYLNYCSRTKHANEGKQNTAAPISSYAVVFTAHPPAEVIQTPFILEDSSNIPTLVSLEFVFFCDFNNEIWTKIPYFWYWEWYPNKYCENTDCTSFMEFGSFPMSWPVRRYMFENAPVWVNHMWIRFLV